MELSRATNQDQNNGGVERAVDHYGQLIEQFQVQSEFPFERDAVIGSFFEASFRLVLNRNETFENMLTDYIENRPEPLTATHAALLLFRTFHHHARFYDPDYPNNTYYEARKWELIITEMLEDEELRAKVADDLQDRNLQSNKEARAWGLFLPLHGLVNAGRFEGPLNILEVGSSRMHIIKLLVLNGHIPGLSLPPITVMQPDRRKVDTPQTELLERIRHTKLPLGDCLAVDMISMKDSDHSERVFSDTFLPSELMEVETKPETRRKLDNFMLLEIAQPPSIEFVKMDFRDSNYTKFLTDRSFDAIFIPSMLYQRTREERDVIEKTCERVVSENGIIVSQDEMKLVKGHSEPVFYKQWTRNWQYRTVVRDMHSPENLQPILKFESSRCGQLIFDIGRLSIGGGVYKTLPELLTS